MEISIEELRQLLDIANQVGRQSAIDVVVKKTDEILVNPNDNWIIASVDVPLVAERLGVDLFDLTDAFRAVDNT